MKRKIALFCCIVLAFIPKIALSEDMNLSGSVYLNEVQNTSTSNMLLSMLISLSESIIPILVGSFVGRKAIRYWNERKNEATVRRNIISEHAQSFRVQKILLDNFVTRIFDAYVSFDNIELDRVTSNDHNNSGYDIRGFLTFPSDISKLPSNRFKDEYDRLALEIGKTFHSKAQLYANLASYKNHAQISSEVEKIEDSLYNLWIILNMLFHSTDSNSFVKFYDRYFIQSNKISDKIKNIELEMTCAQFR